LETIDITAAPALVETSMSTLGKFQRCRRAYMYQEVRGWMPRTSSPSAQIGTLFHAAMAAGLGVVREYTPLTTLQPTEGLFLGAAILAVYQLERDRNGFPLTLERTDRELVDDMVRYVWANYLEAEVKTWDAILAVEEPAYVVARPFIIRNTFDAVIRKQGRREIIDFKTVDDPRDAKEWLALDFQTDSYYLAYATASGGELADLFRHIFVARAVPPGFGHNPILTASGAKRNAKTLESMRDPGRYIQTTETTLTAAELEEFRRELTALVYEIDRLDREGNAYLYTRSTIKAGPFACGACEHYSACKAERRGIVTEANNLVYVVRGSDEWNELQKLANHG
jgi:hypothetical protein